MAACLLLAHKANCPNRPLQKSGRCPYPRRADLFPARKAWRRNRSAPPPCSADIALAGRMASRLYALLLRKRRSLDILLTVSGFSFTVNPFDERQARLTVRRSNKGSSPHSVFHRRRPFTTPFLRRIIYLQYITGAIGYQSPIPM